MASEDKYNAQAPPSYDAAGAPQYAPPQGAPSGDPPQGQPPQGYPPQGQPPQGYPPQGQPPQGYPPQGQPPQGYPPQGQPPQGYPPQGQPQQGYPPQGAYPQYAGQPYPVVAVAPVTVGAVVVRGVQMFGESPVTMTCPHCQAQMTTKVDYEVGLLTWLIVGMLCIFFLWPCCLIPFCVQDCKDIVHTCSNCNRQVGRKNRMS